MLLLPAKVVDSRPSDPGSTTSSNLLPGDTFLLQPYAARVSTLLSSETWSFFDLPSGDMATTHSKLTIIAWRIGEILDQSIRTANDLQVPINVESDSRDRKIAAVPTMPVFAPQSVINSHRQHTETTSPRPQIISNRTEPIVPNDGETFPLLELQSASILFRTTAIPQRYLMYQSSRLRMVQISSTTCRNQLSRAINHIAASIMEKSSYPSNLHLPSPLPTPSLRPPSLGFFTRI